MSELKAFDITLAEEGYCTGVVKYRKSCYDKSEVDKVLAEKDAEIWKWKAARDGCEQQFQAQVEETGKYLSQALELKYKRCLDKAKWCDERIARYTLQQEIQGISWQKEIKFYRRLKDKYIEISKRFNAGE